MATTIEYALMAGCAYQDTRAETNRIPASAGWAGLKHESAGSGFEGISFVPTGTTLTTSAEIVISYAGTKPSDWTGDIATNKPLNSIPIAANEKRQAIPSRLPDLRDWYVYASEIAANGDSIQVRRAIA